MVGVPVAELVEQGEDALHHEAEGQHRQSAHAPRQPLGVEDGEKRRPPGGLGAGGDEVRRAVAAQGLPLRFDVGDEVLPRDGDRSHGRAPIQTCDRNSAPCRWRASGNVAGRRLHGTSGRA